MIADFVGIVDFAFVVGTAVPGSAGIEDFGSVDGIGD
jgi:hypothetical protein